MQNRKAAGQRQVQECVRGRGVAASKTKNVEMLRSFGSFNGLTAATRKKLLRNGKLTADAGTHKKPFTGTSTTIVPELVSSKRNPSEAIPDTTDECSSSGSNDTTPISILGKSSCTVVWSNPVFRCDGSSSSGSEYVSSGEKDCLTENWSIPCQSNLCESSSLKSNSPDTSTRDLKEIRKCLLEVPEFRGAQCGSVSDRDRQRIREEKGEEDKEESNEWVHAPKRDIERECLVGLDEIEEMEDEIEKDLQKELEQEIASLSKKLADIHSRRAAEVKHADASLVVVRVRDEEKSRSHKITQNDALVEMQRLQQGKSKFDWVKSLRSIDHRRPPPEVKNSIVEGNILLERTNKGGGRKGKVLNVRKKTMKENIPS